MSRLFKAIDAVLCLIFALSFAAPNAHADSYSATFTVSGFLVTAPTALDVTFPSPTLDITWLGLAFTVTLPSSSLFTDSYFWGNSKTCFLDVCSTQIEIINLTHPSLASSNGQSVPRSFSVASGSLTFTSVATPEPSSLALMLSGVGLVRARE